ncbi:aspartyl protease family protein [Pedobacter chitinilyticus]|uniref:Peptide-binding protein n=1 Tax=Pedobacter chitinilyticus TaxID=2233776 RepID=A0A443YV09_9SPHI|nr:aspartyl protease family protein [Pedobacter chitinilyticus]RWU07652.1 peptide-binding protein [Pedobacter chitinilyticus]
MNCCKPKIHFHFISAFWVLLYLFSTPISVIGQDFKFQTNRKQQTITFSLVKNLIIIPIYINGKGPFDFILDTGVNPMIVTDSTLKESLKVPYVRNIKIGGYGNFDGIDAFLGATTVNVGEAEGENIPTVFLKNEILSLSGYVGRRIYGLIGFNFFNSFVVKINYDEKSLKFISPGKKIKPRGEKIPLELIDNKPYVSVNIEQEGLGSKTLRALVDCGASHAISLEALIKNPFPLPTFSIQANLGNGLTGPINGRIGRIELLKLGKFVFKDVLANYPKYQIDTTTNRERNANLGAELLSRFNVTYDYRNLCMYIKKNARFNYPFEHDMAGIEFYSDGSTSGILIPRYVKKNARINVPFGADITGVELTETSLISRTLISRIEPGSPADLVGLKEGDQIISINFKDIDDYPIDEISNIFKAKSGYSVILEIWRDKTFLIKLLKLKKRI